MTAAPRSLGDLPVWALNLDKRPDRWDYLTAHLARRGLQAPNRFSAIDGRATTTDAELANYQRGHDTGRGARAAAMGTDKSFITLLTKLIDDGPAEWTMVLEDDAVFHQELHSRWASMAPQVPDDALMVLLGCRHKRKPIRLTEDEPTLCRVVHADCSHAWIATPEALVLLRDAAAPLTTSFDLAWNQVHQLGRTYTQVPHLAIQRENYSDIAGRISRRPAGQFGHGIL